ncbi:MAG: mechanosensitive ion channel family protein [Deltaproteobacteria bacterium]|nr:MAG: mechanosensitive ion channel family protein [Deltaproteobacteria bacterium]
MITPAAGSALGLLVRRVLFWTVLGLFVASALSEVGVDLSVLLGAAGVFTVAIGFASQTSASNIISGVFLLIERPFAVGDVIRLGTTQGEVLSIDLLSVKLRTFDNLYVRVPNETVMKSEIVNVSRFPIRRFDLLVPVARDAPLDEVRALLIAAADESEVVLDEPRPIVIFNGFTEMGMELQLSAWATQDSFLQLRNSLPERAAAALAGAGIATGAPQRVVRMVSEREK